MTTRGDSQKSAEAFRTISEVAESLRLPQHVLRFWETRFVQIKPLKRAGGRRYYRPDDIELLGAIRQLLYGEGYTIRGVQRLLKEQGPRAVAMLAKQADPHDLTWPDASREASLAAEESAIGSDVPVAASEAHSTMVLDPDSVTADRAPGLATDVARLRAVLAELEECRRLLARARS